MKNKTRMNCLCFELTRRCNMNCDFCCRGDAQNIDITPKIIDATLNKVKNYEINMIRITGGEPFLNKDGFIYLVNEIVRRNIMILEFFVFTNGTIIDGEIKEALIKIGKHCKECSNLEYGKRMKEWRDNNFSQVYNTHSFATVIVSTTRHKPIDMERVLKFYRYNEDDAILCSYNQDKSFIRKNTENTVEPFSLEGNGEKNYKNFIKEGKYQFSFVNNKFCIVDDMNICKDGYVDIKKTITISSNGNVFPGCSQAYKKVDKENICNILRCSDLFKSIDLYSWKYPLLQGQNESLKNWLIARWNYEHGITIKQYLPYMDVSKIENDEDRMYELFGSIINGMYNLEETIKYVHKKYPYFTHFQAAMMATYSKALQWYDEMDEEDKKAFYLQIYSGVKDPENLQKKTREEIEKVCKDLCEIYKQHILDNDPLCRFLYKIGVI